MSCSFSRKRDVKQKLDFLLPFRIIEYWLHFLIFGREGDVKDKVFVVYSVNMTHLRSIQVLSAKKDPNHDHFADLIVSLKINNTDIGNILQAVIYMELVKYGKWSFDDIEWVNVRKNILKCLSEKLNMLEKTEIKKWHFNKNTIILIFPSSLTQYSITAAVKSCLEICCQ